ncbi:MAG TPA: rRNA maturation RNase YbeY [Rhizomicrobium sp.]
MTSITLVIEEEKWRAVRGLQARLKRAAALALSSARRKGALTILLSNDKKLKALNRDFRGKDKPTNVLSFPADAGDYLGDVAIAYGVTSKEARASGKKLIDHATHLAVHGVLHLIGHDHETRRDAKIMEPLEVRILGKLGIADPYAVDIP